MANDELEARLDRAIKGKDILVRDIPPDLVAEIDEYTSKNAGSSGRPSRNAAMIALMRRGLADATRARKSAQ
jgi:hypothetical protein